MYSRNTKNIADSYDYPFTLPERYGGSRFRQMKEPKTHVHAETSVSQTPSPIHLSPAVTEVAQESPAIDTSAHGMTDIPEKEEAALTDGTPTETENKTSDENPSIEASAPVGTPSTGFLSSGLDAEELLLIGLILLLSRGGEDSTELPALLALLLAYRPSENR